MDAPLIPTLCHLLGQHIGKQLTPELAALLTSQAYLACYPGPVDISAVVPREVGRYHIACERMADVVDEIKPLHAEHWAETETHRHGERLNPDYARFMDYERMGRFLLVTVREKDSGHMVGNYAAYLNYSTHTQKLSATEDTLFLSRAHRRGRLGVELIRFSEYAMATVGVHELRVTVKLVNTVGPMLERMGYQPVETGYLKLLNR